MYTLLSFCAGVTTLCTPYCHSERSEESYRYFADAQYDTPLSFCASAAMLCAPCCHSERSICHSERASCHSERSEESYRYFADAQYDTPLSFCASAAMLCAPHCHSARAQLCFAHLIVILNAVKNLFNNAQNEMSSLLPKPARCR